MYFDHFEFEKKNRKVTKSIRFTLIVIDRVRKFMNLNSRVNKYTIIY